MTFLPSYYSSSFLILKDSLNIYNNGLEQINQVNTRKCNQDVHDNDDEDEKPHKDYKNASLPPQRKVKRLLTPKQKKIDNLILRICEERLFPQLIQECAATKILQPNEVKDFDIRNRFKNKGAERNLLKDEPLLKKLNLNNGYNSVSNYTKVNGSLYSDNIEGKNILSTSPDSVEITSKQRKQKLFFEGISPSRIKMSPLPPLSPYLLEEKMKQKNEGLSQKQKKQIDFSFLNEDKQIIEKSQSPTTTLPKSHLYLESKAIDSRASNFNNYDSHRSKSNMVSNISLSPNAKMIPNYKLKLKAKSRANSNLKTRNRIVFSDLDQVSFSVDKGKTYKKQENICSDSNITLDTNSIMMARSPLPSPLGQNKNTEFYGGSTKPSSVIDNLSKCGNDSSIFQMQIQEINVNQYKQMVTPTRFKEGYMPQSYKDRIYSLRIVN